MSYNIATPNHIEEKRVVRFAYENEYYSAPSTPALSFSSSTFSSPGPITPPVVVPGLPGPTQPLPPLVDVHSLFKQYALSWNMANPITTAVINNYPVTNTLIMGDQATNVPLPFLTIQTPHLPWTIKVSASNRSFITVGDVLMALYSFMRTNVTPNEFNLFSSPKDRRRATRAYEQRYRRHHQNPDEYEREKRSGMKRIDFLLGHSNFVCISNSGRRPDEFHLIVM